MEDIRFKKNPKNNKREIIKAGMTSVLSVFMLIYGVQYNSLFIIIVFAVFLVLGLYLIYSSLQNKDTVVINEKGISSNANGMGLIEWKYIEDFEIKKAVNAIVLVVKINDIEKLLSQMSKGSKLLMKTNIKKLGSPVIIPESEFNEPLITAKDRIEKYKNSL